MRPIRILGIAPYEGIASLMQQAAESRSDLQIDIHVGNLTVGGQELQIGELSTQSGQVQLSGKIEYLQYAENQQSGGSLLARLFR